MTTTLSSPPTGSQAVPPASPPPPYAAKTKTSRWGLALGGVAVVVLCTAGWSAMRWSRSASELAAVSKFTVKPKSFNVVLKEKGELKAANSTDIKCEVEGRSTIITLIAEGTAVQKGDLLVELASDQINERIQSEELRKENSITNYESAVAELEIQRDRNASDIRKGNLQIELMKLALDKYEWGDYPQQKKDADIRIEEAEITLERRREDHDAAIQLREKRFITQTELKEEEFRWQKAGWEREKAIRAREVLREYTHQADLRKRQSDLSEAKKELDRVTRSAEAEERKKVRIVDSRRRELELTSEKLDKLHAQKEKCRITAPNPGFVVYYSGGGGRHFMSSDNQIKEGASVYERQVLMQLPDTSRMVVVLRIHEAKTDKIELGQPVTIEVEGLPGQQFTGRVTKIAVVADSQNRWLNPDLKEYETEVTLDPTEASLKPGVTAHTEILVNSVENVLAVPVQTIYTKGGKRYLFREAAGEIAPVEIRLGAVATAWAQVVDGLSEGDRICLSVGEEYKRLLPDVQTPERPAGMNGHRSRPPSAGRDASSPGADQQRVGDRAGQGQRPAAGQGGSKERERWREYARQRGRSAGREGASEGGERGPKRGEQGRPSGSGGSSPHGRRPPGKTPEDNKSQDQTTQGQRPSEPRHGQTRGDR